MGPKGRWVASVAAVLYVVLVVTFAVPAAGAIRGCFNGRIAFDSIRNGSRAIYMTGAPAQGSPLPAPTSTPTRLTTGPNDAQPSWSPPPHNDCGFSSGFPPTMIAFQRTTNGNTNIYLIDPSSPEPTGQAVQVTHGGADTSPAWAPYAPTGDVTPAGANWAYPPIAFERSINGHRDIFIANYDGSDPTNVTNSSGTDYANPDWSSGSLSDPLRLSFDSNQGGRREVWTMDVGWDATDRRFVGTNVQQVTPGQPVSSNPSWFTFTAPPPSPVPTVVADRIAFAGPDQDGGPSQINIAEYDRQTANSTGPFTVPSGISFLALTNDTCENTSPAWSADGQLIAYQKTSADGKSDIYVLDPTADDASGDVNLTQHVGDNKNPDWEAPGFLSVELFPRRPLGRRSRRRNPHIQRETQRATSFATTASAVGCPTKTGGTGGTGSGTGGPGSGTGGPGSGTTESGPFAKVVGILVRGRGRSRTILISLKLRGSAIVTGELDKGRRRVATQRWRVDAGMARLSLNVPLRARAGVYRVRVLIRPRRGPQVSFARRVRLDR